MASFEPIRLLEIELSEQLPAFGAIDPKSGRAYQRARLLVRLHTRPLGLVDIELSDRCLEPNAYVEKVWQKLGEAINRHLREDGLAELTHLDSDGVPPVSVPVCLNERRRLLSDHAPFASVVVSTRDRAESLAITLRSLLALKYPDFEVIVVDNAPQTEATAELIKHGFGHEPRVRYVREPRPGLSWGRNCGLHHAHGEIVAFTDDDILADPHWLAELAAGFSVGQNVACVTGIILPAELETPAQVWLEQFGGFFKGRGFEPARFDLNNHRPKDPLFPYLTTQCGAGGNMAFRTSELLMLGGFDPAMGTGTPALGGEDIEAFFRIIAHGHTLVSEPAALLYHFHRRDSAGLEKQLHGYGVAFTAYLTRCLLDNPLRILDLLSIAPHGLCHLLSPHSFRNERKRADYPNKLTRREVGGMLYGPLAYLRSRWRTRQVLKQFGPIQVDVSRSANWGDSSTT